MIEPAAIATASAAAVAACQRASRHIADSLDRVESGDINLPVFKIEIDSLGGIFGSISVKFSDSAITTAIQQSLVGCEEEYWRNVKRSMNDCEATLERVEDVLRSIYQGGVRPVRHGTLQAKSEQRRREIGLLKQHISMYRKTMELSLELIRVYNLGIVADAYIQFPAITRCKRHEESENPARRHGIGNSSSARLV